jgi:hypothetical protein
MPPWDSGDHEGHSAPNTLSSGIGPLPSCASWLMIRSFGFVLGLGLYGNDCARPEDVEDLRERAAKYRAKLGGQPGSD